MARTFITTTMLVFVAGCDPASVTTAPKAVHPVNEITGHIQYVLDGDSLKFQTQSGEVIEIRLDGIDAPEKAQRFGNESREMLGRLTEGRVVYLISTGTDKYGRTLGKLHDGEIFINGEMIRQGMAWHYDRFNDDVRLARLQESARQNAVGLWGARSRPIPPWEFRKQ